MKKYIITCLMIASVMTFSGCKDNQTSQTEIPEDISVSETSAEHEKVPATETPSALPETTDKVATSTVTTTKTVPVQNEEVTTTKSSEISVQSAEENVEKNELPIIADSVTGNNAENHEIPTNTETELSDDVIELPFVPVDK